MSCLLHKATINPRIFVRDFSDEGGQGELPQGNHRNLLFTTRSMIKKIENFGIRGVKIAWLGGSKKYKITFFKMEGLDIDS